MPGSPPNSLHAALMYLVALLIIAFVGFLIGCGIYDLIFHLIFH
jgi:hypothetical protein